jgi:hypothetical protein
MSTQGNGEGGFELVISALLGVVHSRLSYPLGTCDAYLSTVHGKENQIFRSRTPKYSFVFSLSKNTIFNFMCWKSY